MQKPKLILSLTTVSLTALFAVGTASAALSNIREWTQGAASACAPFSPTQQIRTSASGVKNAGTQTFYVACGMPGDYHGYADGGANQTEIVVANRGMTQIKVNCTLRPGYVEGSAPEQGAFPQSKTIEPGEQRWFTFSASEIGLDSIGNPNFTCTLPPGAEVTHMNRYYREDIGG